MLSTQIAILARIVSGNLNRRTVTLEQYDRAVDGYAEQRLRAFGALLAAIHLTQIGDSPAR